MNSIQKRTIVRKSSTKAVNLSSCTSITLIHHNNNNKPIILAMLHSSQSSLSIQDPQYSTVPTTIWIWEFHVPKWTHFRIILLLRQRYIVEYLNAPFYFKTIFSVKILPTVIGLLKLLYFNWLNNLNICYTMPGFNHYLDLTIEHSICIFKIGKCM